MSHILRGALASFGIVAIAAWGIASGASTAPYQASTGDELWKQLIQDAYHKHAENIRSTLPPYSGLPPVLDLTGRRMGDAMCDSGQHAKWEARFTGVMGVQPISDPGISMPSEATSVSLTTTDIAGHIYALPARQCYAVVIAKAISERVCIAKNLRYIYTQFTLEILQDFKRGENESHGHRQIRAAQFGGSVLFPSGQLTTFLLDKDGFVALNERYAAFLWKPIRSDSTYVIVQAYLIKDGLVFPVSATAPNAFHYTKMRWKDFEVTVRSAIAKNIDTD